MSKFAKPKTTEVAKQGLGRTRRLRGEKAVNKAKIDHGTMNFFRAGGRTKSKKECT